MSRVGLHTGMAEQRESGYFGAAVNRAARVAAVAHGRQVIITSVTASLVTDGEWTIADAGAHRLRGLDRREHLFRLHAAGMPSVELAVTSDHRVGNLPHRRAALIGRDRELARIADLIAPGELVTVTGPPGVGKTSLALVAAHRAAADHAEGGWLVELSAAITPHDVVSVVVTALGLVVTSGDVTAEAIAGVIGAQERLIVLDNCEHVIGAVNELVDIVLTRCPHVALVATSRELLGCDGEQLLTLAPLSVHADAGRSDAGRLFVERLARISSTVGPVDADDDLIEDVCRRLDGVPLALELAAARAGTVGVREVGERLATNNFDLGRRGAGPDRHRSLTSVVAWSYELLSPDEQRVLERLALFADGFDLAAADAVCAFGSVSGPIDEHVFSLIDKSLVTVQRSTPVRYRLLEVVRQFCERRLSMRGELDQVGGRLVAHYVDWSARADAGVRGPDEQRWHGAFAVEWNNLRAVTKRAMATDDLDAACRLVCHARWWAALRDRLEVGDWADAVLAVSGAEAHRLSPLLMSVGAEVARRRLKWDQYAAKQAASARLEQVLGDAPEPWVPYTRFFLDAFSLDVEPLPCSVELEQRVGESPFWKVAAAWCRAFMPSTRLAAGARSSTSEHDWEQVHVFVRAAEALGNPTWMARSSHLLGSALRPTDPAQAVTILEGGLAVADSVGNGVAESELRSDLAGAYAETGRPLDSVNLLLDGMAAYRRIGALVPRALDDPRQLPCPRRPRAVRPRVRRGGRGPQGRLDRRLDRVHGPRPLDDEGQRRARCGGGRASDGGRSTPFRGERHRRGRDRARRAARRGDHLRHR